MPLAPLASTPASRSTAQKTSERTQSPACVVDCLERRASQLVPYRLATGAKFPRPFGVEIEMAKTSLSEVSKVLQQALPGKTRGRHDVYDTFGRRWEVKNDEPNAEVATPILHNQADLQMLQRVVVALAEAGAICDEGTGVHVHVDAANVDAPALTYLLALVARHEPYIFSALQVEPQRRENYCRPLALAGVKGAVRAEPQTIGDLKAVFRRNACTAKFVGLNLEPIFSERGFGTIEFRYFNGCLNPHAIGCYVGYAMALMHHTAVAQPPPAPEGHASLPLLLHTIGLGPQHPVSLLLCGQLQKNLEASIAPTIYLAKLVRSQYYGGDAALLLTMGVPAQALEHVLTEVAPADASALLARAVSLLRYLPLEAAASGFAHLREIPAEHQDELVHLAKDLLDHPRFVDKAPRVFDKLCQVPQAQRAMWVRSAKCAPVPVLVKFSHTVIPPLAHAFTEMNLVHPEYVGTVALANKVLTILRDGAHAIKARVAAITQTYWLQHDDADLRGRVMVALLDLEPQQVARLAELTEPILPRVEHPETYAEILEAFCDSDPTHWTGFASRLVNLLNHPDARKLFAQLHENPHQIDDLLQSDAGIDDLAAEGLAPVYA